jgi:phosphatidylinositol alpha-1,6-mannosyltransferase
MGELARNYPAGGLVVSTGRVNGGGDSDRLLPNGVDRVPVEARRLRTVRGLYIWSRRVVALCRTLEPGFIWCGNLKPAAYPASLTRRRTGVPYGIIVHGTDLLLVRRQARASFLKRKLSRALLRPASVIVANSRYTRDLCLDVCEELGITRPPDSVRVVPLGTDPVHFRPGVDSQAVRARYRLGAGRWMLTVANLTPHKGVDTGLRVLAELAERHPDLGYVIVGSGEHHDALDRLAGELGVADRVRFLAGVTDHDLPAIYNSATVYLGVSRLEPKSVEGFGISLVEASACGLPVIGGRSGGIPDTIRHGETGLLVDPTNHREVAGAVDAVLSDTTLADALGTRGRRAVETHFNWNRVTRDMIEIGEEFAREGNPSPARARPGPVPNG